MTLNFYLVMACDSGPPSLLGAFPSRALAEAYALKMNLDPPAAYIRSLYAPEGMEEVAYVCFGEWGSGPAFVGVFLDPMQVPNLPLRPDAVEFYEIRLGAATRKPRAVQRIQITEGAGTSKPVPVKPRKVEQRLLELLPPLPKVRFKPMRQVAREFVERRLGMSLGAALYAVGAVVFFALAGVHFLMARQPQPLVRDIERTIGQSSGAPWLHDAILRARVYEGPDVRYFSAPVPRSRAIHLLSQLPTALLDPDEEFPDFQLPLPDYFGETSRMDIADTAPAEQAELLSWRARFFVNVHEGLVWAEGGEWLVYDFERELLLGRLSKDQSSPWARSRAR